MSEQPTPSDGKRGCPVETWDGPYRMRCSLGAAVGRCAYHGPFEQPDEPAADHHARPTTGETP